MLPDLFRREVFAARQNDWLGSIEISATRYGRSFAACALACVLALVCFLVFGRYTRHERVEGELVPSQGLLSLTAASAGVIARCLVAEGDTVAQDQPIAEIRTDLDSTTLGDTRALIDARLHEQQAGLDADLNEQRAVAEQQKRSLEERSAMLRQQLDLFDAQRALKDQQVTNAEALLDRLRPLREKGVLGAFEWDQRESAVLDARMQLKAVVLQRLDTERALNALHGELEQLPMTSAAKLNEIERKRSDVAQSIARNAAERALIVRAPRAGVIAGLTAPEGQTVAAGQRLAALIPAGSDLQAELWVPSRAVGFVAPGDAVVLRYHAYPYQKFGSHAGHVVDIGKSALPPAELDRLRGRRSEEPMYRIRVALDAQSVAAFGHRMPLKTSMTLDADVLLERQRLIDWIIEPFYGIDDGSARAVAAAGPA